MLGESRPTISPRTKYSRGQALCGKSPKTIELYIVHISVEVVNHKRELLLTTGLSVSFGKESESKVLKVWKNIAVENKETDWGFAKAL